MADLAGFFDKIELGEKGDLAEIKTAFEGINRNYAKMELALSRLVDADSRRVSCGYGLAAAIPAAGIAGREYYETDTGLRKRDNGSSWDIIGWDKGSWKIIDEHAIAATAPSPDYWLSAAYDVRDYYETRLQAIIINGHAGASEYKFESIPAVAAPAFTYWKQGLRCNAGAVTPISAADNIIFSLGAGDIATFTLDRMQFWNPKHVAATSPLPSFNLAGHSREWGNVDMWGVEYNWNQGFGAVEGYTTQVKIIVNNTDYGLNSECSFVLEGRKRY